MNYLAYAIVDTIVDAYYPVIETLSDRIERLEDRVIDREMWAGILWVGLVMAVVTLVALTVYWPAPAFGVTRLAAACWASL